MGIWQPGVSQQRLNFRWNFYPDHAYLISRNICNWWGCLWCSSNISQAKLSVIELTLQLYYEISQLLIVWCTLVNLASKLMIINLFYTLTFSGPFWVCATLVFTTAIAGNLASYLISAGDHQWVYDFHKGICHLSEFIGSNCGFSSSDAPGRNHGSCLYSSS